MSKELHGRRVAFLVANDGVEQVELTEPWSAVEEAGGEPVLVAPEAGTVQGRNHLDEADTFDADLTLEDADATTSTPSSCPVASPTPTICGRGPRRSPSSRPSATPASRSPPSATRRGRSSRPGWCAVDG